MSISIKHNSLCVVTVCRRSWLVWVTARCSADTPCHACSAEWCQEVSIQGTLLLQWTSRRQDGGMWPMRPVVSCRLLVSC